MEFLNFIFIPVLAWTQYWWLCAIYTELCVEFRRQKIQHVKGSNSSKFLFAQALSLEIWCSLLLCTIKLVIYIWKKIVGKVIVTYIFTVYGCAHCMTVSATCSCIGVSGTGLCVGCKWYVRAICLHWVGVRFFSQTFRGFVCIIFWTYLFF